MISEAYLNACYELIFSKKSNDLDISIYKGISKSLEIYEKLFSGDIPMDVRGKFDLLKMISNKMIEGSNLTEIVTSIEISKKYESLRSLISHRMDLTVDEKRQAELIKLVADVAKWTKVNINYSKWKEIDDKLKNGSFETLAEITAEWEAFVKKCFTQIMDFEVKSNIGLVSSINTKHDSINNILSEVRKKVSKENVIPSGIKELDENFLYGGFQPSRLYLFGGISGVGKSILLLNLCIRGARSGLIPEHGCDFSYLGTDFERPERIFLYVTMENYVYESWIRLYCSLLNKTKSEMFSMLNDPNVDSNIIKKEIDDLLTEHNASIQIDFFPANTVSPSNIAGLIKRYNQNPSQRVVKAVYLDYLDLLSPDEKKEFYRLDLGEITAKLKTIAASFEIPLITGTQLNRSAYKSSGDDEPGIESISESIQKLFITDFSAMIIRSDSEDDDKNNGLTKVTLRVDKNRDGKTGRTHVYFDYRRSRFLTKEEYEAKYNGIMKV